MTKVNAVTCPICKDTIFSRANHDFRRCTCQAIYIDGGFSYIRLGASNEAINQGFICECQELEVPQSKKELYDDWNTSKDKYGLIKVD